MATATLNCPRRGTKKIGFKIIGVNQLGGYEFELPCKCNHCSRLSLFFIDSNNSDGFINSIKNGSHINRLIDNYSPIRIPQSGVVRSPEHIPIKIKNVFDEGALCFASNCHNAAGAMFRASIEQALKDSFADELAKAPKKLFTLYSKVKYLSDCGFLSETLVELADCIREDGNDAVHECNVDANTAEDMQEFCVLMLSKLYTEPAKLQLAKERRKQRRNASSEN